MWECVDDSSPEMPMVASKAHAVWRWLLSKSINEATLVGDGVDALNMLVLLMSLPYTLHAHKGIVVTIQ